MIWKDIRLAWFDARAASVGRKLQALVKEDEYFPDSGT